MCLGVVGALVVLEVLLQVGGVLVRRAGNRDRFEVSGGPAAKVVLCVGDSHTYGAPLPADESYPSLLQEYLDRVDPRGGWRVINRGVPGMNSTQVSAAIGEWLFAYRPAFVVVWVGANNYWNRAGSAPREAKHGLVEHLLGRSRLYRIFLTMRTQRELNEPVDGAQRFEESIRSESLPWLGISPRTPTEAESITLEDLSKIARSIRERGVPFVFLTYPLVGFGMQPQHAWHSKAVEAVAAKNGVAVIDTTADLLRAKAADPDAQLVCPWPPPEGRRCLFVNSMGPHPTKLVYRFIAESVGNRIIDELGAAPEPGRGTG